MKLTKIEATKICEDYDLGKLKGLKKFIGGDVNENYELITNQGNYVIKILSKRKEIREWLESQLKLEFRLLEFINKKSFDYEVINPLKNKQNKKISTFNKNKFWVYKKINGQPKNKKTEEDYLEMVKCIAKYHKLVSKFKHNEKIRRKDWILEKYAEMSKVKPKNKIDKLMLENIKDFERILKNLLNMKIRKKDCLINHMDFHPGNFIFREDKVIGIIDFDNVEYSQKTMDLATIITKLCLKEDKFDKEIFERIIATYKRYNKLKYREIKLIPFILLNRLCDKFWFRYNHYKKNPERQEKELRKTIRRKNVLLKEFGDKLRWQE